MKTMSVPVVVAAHPLSSLPVHSHFLVRPTLLTR
jgi:hypothetical protein